MNFYINWWKASDGGQAAKLMNDIDKLTERLSAAKQDGVILGEKALNQIHQWRHRACTERSGWPQRL